MTLKPVRSLVYFLLTAAGIFLFYKLAEKGLRFAPEPIGSHADLFVEGARVTLLLTVCGGIAGIVIGVLAGMAKLQKNLFLRLPAEFYIWVVRGTPLLVQILFVYYALPALIPALKFNEFTASVLALAVNIGAYNAETIRAGILAVPRGQTEAARSLALSRFQTMRWVVLPQALRIVIPPLVNNFVGLLKDSSLASSIGLLELTLAGNRVSSETFQPVPVLTTVAVVYLVMTTAFTLLASVLEKRRA